MKALGQRTWFDVDGSRCGAHASPGGQCVAITCTDPGPMGSAFVHAHSVPTSALTAPIKD